MTRKDRNVIDRSAVGKPLAVFCPEDWMKREVASHHGVAMSGDALGKGDYVAVTGGVLEAFLPWADRWVVRDVGFRPVSFEEFRKLKNKTDTHGTQGV